MSQEAFVFPGQGSQYVGMGQALFANFESARELLYSSDDILQCKLSQVIANGPAEELKKTENTQPALLLLSTAFAQVLQAKGRRPRVVAGHSLGEYSALVANGCLAYDQALKAVRSRGRFMQEAVPLGMGTMSAILGLGDAAVEAVCAEVSRAGQVVEPAGYNCTGQVVIAGHKEAVEKAGGLCKERGAKMVIPLEVSAPFHCRLLAPAAEQLAAVLRQVSFRPYTIPYVANVDAKVNADHGQVCAKLVEQVIQPVRWRQSLEAMVALGVERFVEVGPGKVLCGHIKKTARDREAIHVDDEKSLAQLL